MKDIYEIDCIFEDRVLIKRVLTTGELESGKTKSGIFIPKDAKDAGAIDSNMGVVVKVGDKVTKVKKGDVVIFGRYTTLVVGNLYEGIHCDGESEDLGFLYERDIVAIMNKKSQGDQ